LLINLLIDCLTKICIIIKVFLFSAHILFNLFNLFNFNLKVVHVYFIYLLLFFTFLSFLTVSF